MSLVLTVLALSASAAIDVQARARFDRGTEHLTVEYCTEAAGTLTLRGNHAARKRVLRISPVPDADRGDRLAWTLAEPGCVTLVHELGRIADARRRGVGWRVGGDLLAYADTWWWRPAAQANTRLQLQLPAGWSLSVPWARCDDAPDCRIVPAEPWEQPTLSVFGPFATRSANVGGAIIETAAVGRPDDPQARTLLALGDRAAALIAQAHGTIPTPQLQIVLIPWRSSTQPIGFGQINRGGLGGVQLFIDPNATASALEQDWVLPHELAHLLHPYLGSGRGRWLAEGLASYYQNILRARTNLISADDAWRNLFAGLERGRQDSNSGALDAVADRRGGYMRVYWAGAAFWLEIDLSLRERGHPGLDHLLARFAREHLPAREDWNADRFLVALDAQLLAEGCPAMLTASAANAGQALSFPPTTGLRYRLAAGLAHTIMAPIPTTQDAETAPRCGN